MATAAERIEQQLQAQHHGAVAAAEQNGAILLSGRVHSAEDRAAIEQMAHSLAGAMPIVNLIEVERLVTSTGENETNDDTWDDETEEDGTPVEELSDDALDSLDTTSLDARIEDVPLDTNDIDAVGNDEYDDEDSPEEDPAYFAPTDPVLGSDASGGFEVVGGFDATSLDDETVDSSAEDRIPGDEALADAVRLQLREDASTTDLTLEVVVNRGVVHLRGTVPDLEDAENAESIASTVPGVRDVIDETDVEGI